MKIALFSSFLFLFNLIHSNNTVKDTLFLDDGSSIIGNITDITEVKTDSDPLGKITLYYLVTLNINSADSIIAISKFSISEINYILSNSYPIKHIKNHPNKTPIKIQKIKLVNNQYFYQKEKENYINKAGNQLILTGATFIIATILPILISFDLPIELLYGSIASGGIGMFSLISAGINFKKYSQIPIKPLITVTFNEDGSMNWIK